MSSMALRFAKLPETSKLSLRDQICEVVSNIVTTQALPSDRPLPSCRDLAEQLNVSRNTVFAAYNRLIDLGLLISRDRSGYYVNPAAAALAKPLGEQQRMKKSQAAPVKFEKSRLVPVDNPLDWWRYPYPFIYNQIDPNLFPVDGWRECSRQLLGRKRMPVWTSDSVESDSPELIQQLRQRLLGSRGIYAEDNEILITLEAQNALSIIGLVFQQIGAPIAMENPGFPGARNAFQMAGNRLVAVPIDQDGLIVEAIPPGCQMVFTTPSHQFPSMVTMSQSRRQALLDAAAEKDLLIIEDDYEAEMNYFVDPSPSLQALDRNGRVIYIGSMSKTISPGIRLGFMVAHRDIISEARAVRGVMMRHPPTIVQETAALFLQLGHYDAHLRNIERRYKTRWHTMRDAIAKHFGMLTHPESKGGTCFWLTGPEGFDGTLLTQNLRSRGVLVDRGQVFHLDSDIRSSFRVGFAYVPVKRIEDGVKIIAEEVKRLL